ncbi:hypothetical protein RND71_025149 [Anisodus tanguticus]|uniref:Uncharacterized protein n=1 Tax=Anisodus tanguticus TaxID=243964 RepID=A0AAE1RSH9_9SOLA|nr:hypothetical protein RND71_025149 [Anisodus tanguticus]
MKENLLALPRVSNSVVVSLESVTETTDYAISHDYEYEYMNYLLIKWIDGGSMIFLCSWQEFCFKLLISSTMVIICQGHLHSSSVISYFLMNK